jgi:hypothetical protein
MRIWLRNKAWKKRSCRRSDPDGAGGNGFGSVCAAEGVIARRQGALQGWRDAKLRLHFRAWTAWDGGCSEYDRAGLSGSSFGAGVLGSTAASDYYAAGTRARETLDLFRLFAGNGWLRVRRGFTAVWIRGDHRFAQVG